jgi:hypothetical protein
LLPGFWENLQPPSKFSKKRRLEGELALILRQLVRRVGAIAPDLQAQLQALPLPQLEDLGEALLDFSDPADLTVWLNNHSHQEE